MKKNILMVYPEFPSTYWSYKYALPFIGKKAIMPPLGLLTVAAMLPSGYNIKLVDMNIEPLLAEDIKNADMVFISAMIIQKESFEYAVNLCIECGVPVAAGGPYPTTSHEKISGVSHFILNEAEVTLPGFIYDLENGTAKEIYADESKPDITHTPVPRFDLLKMNAYLIMSLQFSRGCPFNCEFCDIIEMFGRVPRTKLYDQFIDEISAVYDAGFRGPVFIVDDNFIGNKTVVKRLLNQLREWQADHGFPFTFFTEASINLAGDEELMDLMVAANFDMVFVGIETPDAETLKFSQKNHNAAVDLCGSVKKIQSKGLEVSAGFIIGFDTDRDDIFDRQIEFIQRAGIPISMIGLMLALPNTQLHRRLKKENRLLAESSGNNTHELKMNFIPKMPIETIVAGYNRVISALYTPRKYFERSLTLIKNLPDTHERKKSLYLSDFKALFFSLVKQGFSRYGLTYYKYLIKVLWYNRIRFPKAIDLAVKGHHFFKITGELVIGYKFTTAVNEGIRRFDQKLEEVLRSGSIHDAGILQNSIISLKKKISRRYGRLNAELQHYMADINNKFVERSDKIIMILSDGIEDPGGSAEPARG